ncbi:hypothetical protein BDBG_16579 [Blastomyces gilchristii SLH14081]|uniref:Secreted protein n=1 Tax=Blastomyces gilchristii (strain SLH14081) TaxID=559298 RepID=A0A179UE14_BLAGS|nr:uncharacterized protein BDBG_16579 [Blastomyces gilchristii SLH14081]OAT06214.1 hypothetical protein BDBG_16579 [Blastomyces gilchristii SLH14081]
MIPHFLISVICLPCFIFPVNLITSTLLSTPGKGGNLTFFISELYLAWSKTHVFLELEAHLTPAGYHCLKRLHYSRYIYHHSAIGVLMVPFLH